MGGRDRCTGLLVGIDRSCFNGVGVAAAAIWHKLGLGIVTDQETRLRVVFGEVGLKLLLHMKSQPEKFALIGVIGVFKAQLRYNLEGFEEVLEREVCCDDL